MSSSVSAQTMRGIEASANTLSMSLSFARKNVLDLQNDIALKAAQRLACDDLERKWTAFTPEERREYCLEGLYMASTQYGADLGFNRKWCPDLTLDRLSSTPTTYLSLLRRFVPEDLEHTITDLIVIEDAAVNRLIQNVPKIMVDRWQCDRMFYLSMVVWRILLAVYGEQEGGQVVASPVGNRNRDLPKEMKKAAKNVMGSAEYRDFSRNVKANQKADNQARHYCMTCYKTAGAVAANGGGALRRCSKCASVGRVVEYCSKECQVKDWRSGYPVPHKKICGITVEDTPAVDNEQCQSQAPRFREDLIPPPSSGIKRSPWLLKQIERVQEPPYVDYVLPTGDGFNLNDSTERELFMVVRRRAFQNGDATSVGELYALIHPYMAKNDISATALAKQLRQEYSLSSFNRALSMADIRPASTEETAHAQRAIAVIGRRGPATPEAPWVPKPDERQWGRKPPAALAKQVEYLNKPPYVDYVAFRPSPYDDVGINCPIQHDMILALRRRAIESGDKVAATMLLLLLSPLVELRYRDDFAAQFRQEYDITEAELARVIQELGDEEASPQEPAAKLTFARHGQSAADLPHYMGEAAPDPRAVAVVGPRNPAMMPEGDPEPEYSG
ncbi:hypothetical protein EV714DRAFT_273929 [Schizophyllum commune]